MGHFNSSILFQFQKFRYDDEHPFLVPKLYKDLQPPTVLPAGAATCRVQVLRSTCSWSAGLLPDVVEHSLQQGYIDLIRESKHFVYLEA